MFDSVIDQILGYLAVVLAGALVALVVKVFQYFGMKLDEKAQAKLQYYAEQGINKAKEIAAERLKKSGGALVLTAQDKATIAFNHVIDNVPNALPSKVDSTIKATLPELGEGASGKA